MNFESGSKSGSVAPSSFDACPERVIEIARIKLEAPTFEHVLGEVQKSGFYPRQMVENIYASLILGNVILAGPPGTGKTALAKAVADAFRVQLSTETANPEWSVYDIIGSQFLNDKGGIESRSGIVTKAILDCAKAVVANLDTGGAPQATWLLIDELNRAEIDRAFGPLFTALSSSDVGTFRLDHLPGNKQIAIPARFRIIATVNDYDTRFVNSMSGALRRRFARVPVGPPPNDSDGGIPSGELNRILEKARISASGLVSQAEFDESWKHLIEFNDDIRIIFGAFRNLGDHGGVPIGSALIIDTLAYASMHSVVVKAYAEADRTGSFWNVLDRSLSTRLIAALETDATRLRLKDGYLSAFREKLPQCPASLSRLTSFIHAVD